MKKRFSPSTIKIFFVAFIAAGLFVAGSIGGGGKPLQSPTQNTSGGGSQSTQEESQEVAAEEEDEYIRVGNEVCEMRGDELVIKDTYCPCPTDPALASVCGYVSSANILGEQMENSDKTIYSTRKPISDATVAIYENDPYAPTGKPFGNLEKKLVECQTSEKEGKYHCYMRRITPGTAAYVIFACSGMVADIKIISSGRSITTLDSDVDCGEDQNHTHLPDILDYVNRDQFLGCLSSEDNVPNKAVGYEDQQEIFFSANIGELGDQGNHTGDIRFTPFEGISGGGGVHPGGFVENDCLIESFKDLERIYIKNIPSIFVPTEITTKYSSIYQKCNYNPTRDNLVENSAMVDTDERTTPFRYDIPTFLSESVTQQIRVWESRTSLQRVNEWPFGPQQFLHAMFGECSMITQSRYYGDDTNAPPVSCEVFKLCNSVGSDPFINISTGNSLGAMLENPSTYYEMAKVQERDKKDIVCLDKKGNEIALKDIQPPWDNTCDQNGGGCSYKLGKEYFAPQLLLAAQGARVDYKTDTFNDAYGIEVETGRENIWELAKTEAKFPHSTGDYVNYEVPEKSKEQNSAVSAIRVATDGSASGLTTVRGVLANKLVSPVDAQRGTYQYTYDHTVYDVNGNVESLCTMSAINGGPYAAPIVRNKDQEAALLISNFFVGDAADHRASETAGVATYATEFGRARDVDMQQSFFWRDTFDSVQRYRIGSGGGEGTMPFDEAWDKIYGFIGLFSASRGVPYKSYANRSGEWNPDTPSYMFVDYCIAEENFNDYFPAYGQAGYPGSYDGCYDWNEVAHAKYCNSWPGVEGDWPNGCGGTSLPAGYECPFGNTWPGIEGELRTCKQEPEDECMVMSMEIRCKEKIPVNGMPGVYYCVNDKTETVKDYRSCTPDDRKACLELQQDGYDHWRLQNELGYGWDYLSKELAKKGLPKAPKYKPVKATLYACSLKKAGPMVAPGKIFKDHAARTRQDALHEEQVNADAMLDVMNYTTLSMSSPVDERKYGELANFLDYAVTNDLGDGADASTAIQGGGAGAVHKYTAGAQGRGLGVGNVVELIKTVSFPERPQVPTEDYPEITSDNVFCTLNKEETNWCRLIPPPEEEIDLKTITGGACNPNLKSGNCKVKGVGELAGRILGAAGKNAGVPGSLLLAAIVGEGGWLDPATGGGRLQWDDESVARFSEPWYARMPKCQEMVWSAQGPFGLLDHWFRLDVWGDSTYFGRPTMSGDPLIDSSVGGGYHPLRVNKEGGIVASKCNFIDAAYAAAWEMKKNPKKACGAWSRADMADGLAMFRGGVNGNAADVPGFLLDIAMGCK